MNEVHFLAWAGDHLVGAVGLETNPYNDQEIWGKFVVVDADYRGMGIGGALTRMAMDYAKQQGKQFVPSSYTQDGELKIKPIIIAR